MTDIKRFHAALSRRFGEEAATSLIGAQQERYARLYAGQQRYNQRALRSHLEHGILPGLALYQVLREHGIDRQEALSTTQAALEETMKPRRKLMAWLGKLPLFFPALRALLRRTMSKDYPAEGWETEWLENSPARVAFDIHRCFYLDTLAQYGAPELTASFCALDDVLYDGVWPHAKWGRTETLGRGDKVCKFRFEKM